MRTCAWFHTLRMRTGAKSTNAMEKMLEPGSFGVDESGTGYKRNKWRGYRLGKHTPSPALVQPIEQMQPGSHGVFDHVLWDTLRPDCTLARHHLVNRLGPKVSKILSIPQLRKKDGNLRGDFVERIERVADLDGLACLVALLRDAINANNDADAQQLALALCRSAIAAGPLLYSLGIAGPFADYINDHLLCRATAEGGGYRLNAHDYLLRAKRAAQIIDIAEGNENCRFTYTEKVDYILDILRGRYGDRLEQHIAPRRSAAL